MRTTLAILAAATLVSVATLWPTENNKVTAWRKLEREVEKLRPLVSSADFHSSTDAVADECRARISAIDEKLDARASSSDGIGAPWMWKPEHREALFDLVKDVQPLLDELAGIAELQCGMTPLPWKPSLGRSRHRTNLFCGAAILESDHARARTLFEQAWAVATMEDDGSWVPLAVQLANAGVIADGVRIRSERFGHRDEMLSDRMSSSFALAFTLRGELERNARGLVQFVDQADRPDTEMWAIEAGAVASSELYPVLMGTVSIENFLARVERRHLLFANAFLVGPELNRSIAHNLRM